MKKTYLLITILLLMTGCLYAVRYDATFKGRIIDADTGQPIEGVVVLGVWYLGYPSVAGVVHKYYDAKETVTDKKGEFKISGFGPRVMSNLEPMNVLIFKAGYMPVDDMGPGVRKTFREESWSWENVEYDGDRLIIPLKKLTMEERKKQGRPNDPPTEAPLKKVKHMLREIDRDRIERGLDARGIWGGERYE